MIPVKPNRFQIEDERQRMLLQKFIGARPLPFQCEVGKLREQRSLPQNNLLWQLHTLAAAATGYTPEEMHEEMLCTFYGYTEKDMPSGWKKRVPLKRSSTRDKEEFRVFLDNVQNYYAATFGVWLDSVE
jgi:hypothetical protein